MKNYSKKIYQKRIRYRTPSPYIQRRTKNKYVKQQSTKKR